TAPGQVRSDTLPTACGFSPTPRPRVSLLVVASHGSDQFRSQNHCSRKPQTATSQLSRRSGGSRSLAIVPAGKVSYWVEYWITPNPSWSRLLRHAFRCAASDDRWMKTVAADRAADRATATIMCFTVNRTRGRFMTRASNNKIITYILY